MVGSIQENGDSIYTYSAGYICRNLPNTAKLLLRSFSAQGAVSYTHLDVYKRQELSSATSTNINLPFITADANGPKHLDMTLTRAKFNELTADLVDRTMTPVRKALADAGLQPSDLKKVLMLSLIHISSRTALTRVSPS